MPLQNQHRLQDNSSFFQDFSKEAPGVMLNGLIAANSRFSSETQSHNMLQSPIGAPQNHLDLKESQRAEEDEDEEFIRMAVIFYNVNLIQRSFKGLKGNLAQKRKQSYPVTSSSNHPVSQADLQLQLGQMNNNSVYELTFEDALLQKPDYKISVDYIEESLC
jgi:hypothetical protein